jgi:hypothetical protein
MSRFYHEAKKLLLQLWQSGRALLYDVATKDGTPPIKRARILVSGGVVIVILVA